MQSNIVEFFKTRKFWAAIINLILTVVIWGVPAYSDIVIPVEVLGMITAFLWSIAGYVVYGDVQYDWKVLEAASAPKS